MTLQAAAGSPLAALVGELPVTAPGIYAVYDATVLFELVEL